MHAVKYEAAYEVVKKQVITNSKECEIIFREIWDTPTINKYESVYAIYLNNKREVIDTDVINIGMHSRCEINMRTVLEGVFTNSAFGVVIAHNHPSGSAKPSQDDIQATKSIKNLCSQLEINLVDHLIITEDAYFSLRDNSYLN